MKIKQNNKPINIISKFIDLRTFLIAIVLLIFGIFAIYSATIASDPELVLFYKQSLFAIIGLVTLIVISTLPTYFLKSAAIPFYIFTIALLVITYLFGTAVYGTRG